MHFYITNVIFITKKTTTFWGTPLGDFRPQTTLCVESKKFVILNYVFISVTAILIGQHIALPYICLNDAEIEPS